jgi:histidinol-phosphate/aromatic aminotransferase/cobyric acid decarboxylase-like protein
MIRRFLDYYRQFEELSPEEISRELRERSDAERARALAEVPALDLATAAWHEPPDPEAVNAATYALRRAVNAYPDPAPLLDAIAASCGVARGQLAAGHGAGELLRAAMSAIAPGGEVAVAWPGWGPLPRLVHEAGGTPVPVPLTAGGAPDPAALTAAAGPDTRAVALCTPNDPTGAAVSPAALQDLAGGLDEPVWLVVDAALAEFGPDEPVAGVATLLAARERVVVVRSFSKAHAMAGFRAGYAVANDRALLARLAPVAGVAAPAQAAMLWAVSEGGPVVARRRATAARERTRLAEALRDTPLSFPAGHGHLVWLSSTGHDGAAIARHLAGQRIYVSPGAAWGDGGHVRAALRGSPATDRLIAALRDL